MIKRLAPGAGRYAVAGAREIEAGVLVRGDSEETGDEHDDGVIVFVSIETSGPLGGPWWIDLSATVDDGSGRVDRISLFGRDRDDGSRETRRRSLASTPRKYARLHKQLVSGELSPRADAPTVLDEPEALFLRQQVTRILNACASDSELTARYSSPRKATGYRTAKYPIE